MVARCAVFDCRYTAVLETWAVTEGHAMTRGFRNRSAKAPCCTESSVCRVHLATSHTKVEELPLN